MNGACVQKVWGGCDGNANRFFTLVECLMTCEGRPGSRPCPNGRIATQTCLQCGVSGGCRSGEACARSCEKLEDCAAEGSGYACADGVCGLLCF